MVSKKHIIVGFIFLVFLLGYFYPKKPSLNLYNVIKNENIEDLRLTIYYAGPNFFNLVAWKVDDLINADQTRKIVINGSELKNHIDLFKQISDEDLIPVWKKSPYMDAKVYYVLESKKSGKLLDVAMWGVVGDSGTIFVNGYEVKENEFFIM